MPGLWFTRADAAAERMSGWRDQRNRERDTCGMRDLGTEAQALPVPRRTVMPLRRPSQSKCSAGRAAHDRAVASAITKAWNRTHRLSGDQSDAEATIPQGPELLAQLQAVTPAAIEIFCADVLKHPGLERVEVTGGVGAKGIDGDGYLPIGPVGTTKIAFQCRRQSGSVSSREVRS